MHGETLRTQRFKKGRGTGEEQLWCSLSLLGVRRKAESRTYPVQASWGNEELRSLTRKDTLPGSCRLHGAVSILTTSKVPSPPPPLLHCRTVPLFPCSAAYFVLADDPVSASYLNMTVMLISPGSMTSVAFL